MKFKIKQIQEKFIIIKFLKVKKNILKNKKDNCFKFNLSINNGVFRCLKAKNKL